jgi:exonuclease VII small subunit
MNSDSIFACGGCERERLEIAMDYYEQARELKYEWAAARIERTRERLKKLEQDDQDDSAAEPSK